MGLYYGIHDPVGNTKATDSFITDDAGAFLFSYTPPGSSEGNMLHDTGYPIVIKPFEGDWYDAANLYREWVLPNAEWVKAGRMDERNTTPEWAYNLTTWLTPFLSTHENFNTIVEIGKRLDLD